MKKANKASLSDIIGYVGKYKALVIISLLLALVSAGLSLYLPYLIGKAIDLLIYKGTDMKELARLTVTAALVVALTTLTQWLMNMCNNRVSFGVVRDIREKAMKKIVVLPLKYIDSHGSGDTASKVISDAEQFSDGLLMGFSQLFTGIVTIIGTLVFMLAINFKIALIVVLLTPLSLFVARFIATRTRSMFEKQSETRGRQTAFIQEVINGQKTLKAYGQEENSKKRFGEINKELTSCSLKAIFFSSLTNPCTRFVNNIIYAVVAMAGAFAVISASDAGTPELLTVGALSCLLAYATQYTKPFNEISGVIAELQNALACAGRIFGLIEEEAETPDSQNAHTLVRSEGSFELKDVCFSYDPEKKLIEHLDLSVQKGRKVAIVGPTGCGKTTLINLIMRFYDVDSGEITVDDRDIREITRRSLRSNIGMVLQETWLKSGTIRENLKMGAPFATDDEMIEAAKASSAHSFIKRLPNGYDTYISEDGGSLSEGQKQLLCIARVMLCKPPILILDEATSSIDTLTEVRVQQAFDKLMEGRTVFVVAHRLSTVKNADTIIVMDNGKIIEQGRHSELLEKGGAYSRIWKSQFIG